MKVLLFGGAGQLGTDLRGTKPASIELFCPPHPEADIAERSSVATFLNRHSPDAVVNAAAFNLTDQCEINPEIATRANADGPAVLAALCRERGVRLLHFSTDYVFDGTKPTPYVESDAPHPLSQYGRSKREGEKAVLGASPDFWVVRSSCLFGRAGSRGLGGNFVESILARARSGAPLTVVNDVRMSPTYTRDLAERTWQLLGRGVPGGVYHVANDGSCTWFEFAVEILRIAGARADVLPLRSDQWPAKFSRPAQSALASERAAALGFPPMRPWPEALRDYLAAPRSPEKL